MSTTVTTIVVSEHQLSDDAVVWTLEEVCERTALRPDDIRDLIDLGLIGPASEPKDDRVWTFRDPALARLQRAARLRRELELDWAGVAVALDLMEEIERLRRRVDTLSKQLLHT